MIDKQLLQKRFSKNAKTYDQYASVQKKMADELLAIVEQKTWEHELEMNILEIGCGTGYVTEQLCNLFPHARITAVDLAPGMIEMAEKRLRDRGVTFYCGDIEEMILDGEYDLIISNATFQWFNQLENTVKKLAEKLKSNGVFCFSTFGNLTFHEMHTSFERAKQNLHLDSTGTPGQSFFTLQELHTCCATALHEVEASSFLITGNESMEVETFATVRDFFTSIKKIGASNSNQDDYCQRPSVFKEMIKIYETDFCVENLVKATYHCLFLTIEKNKG
jgi:malonyl-CoA O-methyltransferase